MSVVNALKGFSAHVFLYFESLNFELLGSEEPFFSLSTGIVADFGGSTGPQALSGTSLAEA